MKKRARRILSRLVRYALFLTLPVLAYGFHLPGAGNVLTFIVWAMFAVSLPVLLHKPTQARAIELAKQFNRPTWLRIVDGCIDLAVIFALVWHGSVLTALAWGVHAITGPGIETIARDEQQAADGDIVDCGGCAPPVRAGKRHD